MDYFPLTVELQDRVVDFTLDLPCALEGARHPQALVHGHRGDDVVPDIGRHLPLRQDGADYQSDYAQERKGESQNLQTRVGHFLSPRSSTTFWWLDKDNVHLLRRSKRALSRTWLNFAFVLWKFAPRLLSTRVFLSRRENGTNFNKGAFCGSLQAPVAPPHLEWGGGRGSELFRRFLQQVGGDAHAVSTHHLWRKKHLKYRDVIASWTGTAEAFTTHWNEGFAHF